jgi:hypothetical protein
MAGLPVAAPFSSAFRDSKKFDPGSTGDLQSKSSERGQNCHRNCFCRAEAFYQMHSMATCGPCVDRNLAAFSDCEWQRNPHQTD